MVGLGLRAWAVTLVSQMVAESVTITMIAPANKNFHCANSNINDKNDNISFCDIGITARAATGRRYLCLDAQVYPSPPPHVPSQVHGVAGAQDNNNMINDSANVVGTSTRVMDGGAKMAIAGTNESFTRVMDDRVVLPPLLTAPEEDALVPEPAWSAVCLLYTSPSPRD